MNENLKKNIHRLYLAQAISLVCTFLLLIPLVNLVAAIALLVGAVIGIVGMVSLRNEHPDYMNAVYFWLGGILVNLFKNMVGDGSALESVLSLVSTILSLGVIYYVIRATDSFLVSLGREDVPPLGQKAWKIQLIAVAVSVAVLCLTLLVPVGALFYLLVQLAVGVYAIWTYMKYLEAAEGAF